MSHNKSTIQPAAVSQLIERLMPTYHFSEVHSRYIPHTSTPLLDLVTRPAVFDDPIARRLITLRELPSRLAGQFGYPSALEHRPAFGLNDFTYLGRDGDREVAYGLAGRFWRADFGLISCSDAHEFTDLDVPGTAKLVMNFAVHQEEAGATLSTTTRIFCDDVASRRRLRLYWTLIRPASGLIRRRLLKRVSEAARNDAARG